METHLAMRARFHTSLASEMCPEAIYNTVQVYVCCTLVFVKKISAICLFYYQLLTSVKKILQGWRHLYCHHVHGWMHICRLILLRVTVPVTTVRLCLFCLSTCVYAFVFQGWRQRSSCVKLQRTINTAVKQISGHSASLWLKLLRWNLLTILSIPWEFCLRSPNLNLPCSPIPVVGECFYQSIDRLIDQRSRTC